MTGKRGLEREREREREREGEREGGGRERERDFISKLIAGVLTKVRTKVSLLYSFEQSKFATSKLGPVWQGSSSGSSRGSTRSPAKQVKMERLHPRSCT
jgi:hypothetical protein